MKLISGRIIILQNYSIEQNLKLQDKFGSPPGSSSECLLSKELLIVNKLKFIVDLKIQRILNLRERTKVYESLSIAFQI